MPEKIAVFTGSRADYGLLRPVLILLKQDPYFQLQLVVSGSHLSHDFGYTLSEIDEDGFHVDAQIPVLQESTVLGISKAMGLGLMDYAQVLNQLAPDKVMVLGDRFEAFAFAIVAHIANVPIVHLYGGEVTQGAIDDAFRHAISKMASLHFVSTSFYRKRVIQLGESPDTVFHVGSLALDNLKNLTLLSKSALSKDLGIQFLEHLFLITVHPETLYEQHPFHLIEELLKVLPHFKNTTFVFTKANADPLGQAINERIAAFVAQHDHAFLFDSLGTRCYFSLMTICDVVIGNSSSGILEAPFFKVPSVNIGGRQQGRVCSDSVIHCEPDRIHQAIDQALSLKSDYDHPYAKPDSAKMILHYLKKPFLRKKTFYDIPVND